MPAVEIEVPVEGEGDGSMALEVATADGNIMSVIMSESAKDAAGAGSRRIMRADQLAADSAAMWAVALTTPTVFASMGFRTMQQSAGYPANSGTGTAPTP